MACTMFTATFSASQEITRTFDIIWALEAGLWNLRVAAKKYFEENPNADKKTAKDSLVKGLNVHGLNAKRIANELTWEYEEQYVAELLLTYGIGIFDSWVDGIVDTVLMHSSNKSKKKIKEDLNKGEFQTFENALSLEPLSALAGCFHLSPKRQDQHIDNLRLIYKYFKSCRNCCAHGNHQFTDICEANYNAIKTLTKEDCGINEFPKMVETKAGDPVKLVLRGVVGFFDVLIKIINHYDIVASDKIAVENELPTRWSSIPYEPIASDVKRRISITRYEKKRNHSIRYHLKVVNMYAPYVSKTDQVYIFLRDNGLMT